MADSEDVQMRKLGKPVDDELDIEVSPLVDMHRLKPSKAVGTLAVAYKLRVVLCLVVVAVASVVLPGPSTQFVKLTFFAARHGGGDCHLSPSSEPCRKASSDITVYHGVSSAVAHSLAWIVALLAGSYSDFYGRRPPLIVAALLSLLSRLSLASHLFGGASLWVFLFMEPTLTMFDIRSVFLAVMSDVIVDPGMRVTSNTVLLGIALTAAACAGLLGAALSAQSAVILSIVLGLVQIVFLVTCFSETAPVGRIDSALGNFDKTSLNPISVLRDATRLLLRNSFIVRVTLILFFTFLSSAGFQNTFPPYLAGYLGFTQKTNGQLMMVCGISVAVSFVFGMKPLLARFGNIGAVRICLAIKVVYCLLCALAWSPAQVFLVHAVFLGPVVLMVPVMLALQSNLVDGTEQGQMNGVLAAVKIVATAAGELFFAWFYKYSTESGANPHRTAVLPPLLLAVSFAIVASMVSYSLSSNDPNSRHQRQEIAGAANDQKSVEELVIEKHCGA